MRKYIFILLLACSLNASAQRFGIMAGGGLTWYYGEMNDRVISHKDLLRTYLAAGVVYRLSNRLDLWASYMQGSVAGADSLAIRYTIRGRNLSFESRIKEAGLFLGFRLVSDEQGPVPAIPYVFAGVSGYHFHPRTRFNDSWVDLQKLGTEGQYISEGNYPLPYELYQLSVPLGAGIEIRLSRAIRIRVEAANHFLFNDYLDDVSGTYPDSSALSAAPNGALAVELSSRFTDGSFPAAGIARGNSKNKDSFVHAGVMILWTPRLPGKAPSVKKKRNRHLCPAYH